MVYESLSTRRFGSREVKKVTIREAIAFPRRVSVARTPAPRRIRKSARRFMDSSPIKWKSCLELILSKLELIDG